MSPQPLSAVVRATEAGQLLVAWLAARFGYRSTEQWRHELDGGRVRRNGRAIIDDEPLVAGDRIECTLAADLDVGSIEVLHEDQELLVVDKPAGAVVQAASAFAGRTFVASLAASRELPELHCVHRLDRDTSGVLLLAKSAAAAAAWQRRLAGESAHKRYLALVRGSPDADAFGCELPIGGSRGRVKARRSTATDAVRPRAAATSFAVLARGPGLTLLLAHPRTGRTHQIRVHLEALGLPLCGDKLYGRTDAEYLADVGALDSNPEAWRQSTGHARHLLHAARLRLPTGDGTELEFAAPLPRDFATALADAGIVIPVPFRDADGATRSRPVARTK